VSRNDIIASVLNHSTPAAQMLSEDWEEIKRLRATISRLLGYLNHDPECKKNLEYDISCDCGYDALMAELGETK
jgi:hypothetical protein